MIYFCDTIQPVCAESAGKHQSTKWTNLPSCPRSVHSGPFVVKEKDRRSKDLTVVQSCIYGDSARQGLTVIIIIIITIIIVIKRILLKCR